MFDSFDAPRRPVTGLPDEAVVEVFFDQPGHVQLIEQVGDPKEVVPSAATRITSSDIVQLPSAIKGPTEIGAMSSSTRCSMLRERR
ncbi:hypothetical protein M2189_001025 [Bradyrhizobium japonicum]|uniref:hypothetical protein n=1 Tax=Bradyrhizobium japonicum TaxID=375 RepID=UPI00216A4982|nr:hypothetical protein [Bradyrhizobium japonicum]MCS3500021.1 hypothetical protein [Bradyrhizobium japonicum]MCS3957822.1 hypothetical protein [Bradyrhizobium japonicum]MCS3999573.1 hypothetical protein [Bradyrhizobium japonicum]